MKDADNLSGIYKITNTLNGKFYYGSTKRLTARFKEHKCLLLKGNHRNPKLQADFNKCLRNGNHNFLVFEIIELIEGTQEKRTAVEKRYINENYGDGSLCYNIERNPNRKEGSWSHTPEETIRKRVAKLKGQKRTLEQRSNMSKGQKNIKHCPHTEETKKKISETMKKEDLKPPSWEGKHHIPETIDKMRQVKKDKMVPVVATNISTGKEQLFNSVNEASRKLDLFPSSICYVISGKLNKTGDWIFKRQDLEQK